MKRSILIYSIFFFVAILGCEKAADVSSPSKYEKNNIRFSYPSNWKVKEDVEKNNYRYIIIESPGDAVFIVQIYLKQNALSLDKFVEWFSEQTKKEIPVGNMGKNTFTAQKRQLMSGLETGIKESFSIALLGQQVPHIREYFSANTNNKTAFLISQTATEDWSKVESGFNLIFTSFVME